MPTVSIFQEIAANAVVDLNLNPVQRFGPRGGRIRVYATAEIIAALRLTLMVGTDSIMDRGFIPIASTAGKVDVPNDLMCEGYGSPHDPITLRCEEVKGAITDLYAKVVVDFR